MCKRTGRKFSGADLFYADMANDRAGNAEMDNLCVLPGVSEHSRAVWQAEAHAKGMMPKDIANYMQTSLFGDNA